MLLNPYRFGSAGVSLTGLISYWKLDEGATGNAIDAHGTNILSDPTGVTSAAGKINTARDFFAGDGDRLERNSNATLQAGDIEFTFTAWFKVRSLGAGNDLNVIVSKDNNASSREYLLAYQLTGRICGSIFPLGTTASEKIVVGNSIGAPSTGVWYFVVFWHDPAADKIYLQFNNGAINEAAVSGGTFVGTSQFKIGSRQTAFASFDGQIDEVGFWKRILTPAERAQLYNSGNGLTYPFT